MPIASVYQYFPMKLAIVREMWTRYTSAISETLTTGIRHSIRDGKNDPNQLIGMIIDRMAELQASNPAFIEIWSCVAASIELRALNVEDTLQNARLIADALQKMHPQSDPSTVYDRALIAIEMASATTRLALALPEPHRARVLLSLKNSLSLLLGPGTFTSRTGYKKSRPAATVRKPRSNRKAATPKSGSFSR